MALAREARVARTGAHGWLEATPLGRMIRRAIAELVHIEIADRAMTLAAKMFTSVLPVIIAGTMFSGWDLVARGVDDQFGYDPTTLSPGGTGLQATDPSFAAFGVAGLLMITISGTSFARTLGRIYGKIWEMPPSDARRVWRWLVVLCAVVLAAPLLGVTRELADLRYVGVPLALLAEFVIWMFVWTLTPFLLTAGWLSGRVLWATGAITAAGLTAVRAGGRIVLPRTTETSQTQFGAWGLVFTTIGWLFILSLVIVGSPAIVKALALDDAVVGRFLRGPEVASAGPTSPS